MNFRKKPGRSLSLSAQGTLRANLVSTARIQSSSSFGGATRGEARAMLQNGGSIIDGMGGTQCVGFSARATASDRYAVYFPGLEALFNYTSEIEIRTRIDMGRTNTVLQMACHVRWEDRQLIHDLQRERYEEGSRRLVLVAGFPYRATVTAVDADRNEHGLTMGAMPGLRLNIEWALRPVFDNAHPVVKMRRTRGVRLKA